MMPGKFYVDIDMALEQSEKRSSQNRLSVQGAPRAELLSQRIHSKILEENGPAGGNALVRLKSSRCRLTSYLEANGYDLECHEIESA